MSLRRAASRLVVVLAVAAGYAVRQLLRGHPRNDPTGPARLRSLLLRLGGTYIKLGQLLSLQSDLLPRRYCDALFDLLDRVPAFSGREVARILEEGLGGGPDELFDEFSESPIAAASIAQVYVAWLDGRKLAVKVQRPDAVVDFHTDLRLLGLFGRLLSWYRPTSSIWPRLIEELTIWTLEELDFRQEARYQRALAELTRGSPRERVPEVWPELSCARVLTSEFLDGPTMLDHIRRLDGVEGPQTPGASPLPDDFDPGEFARGVVETFVAGAFDYGLFHADLHPANLIVLPGNVVGHVDFGITGALSRHARRHIVGMIDAILREDPASLSSHFLCISTREPNSSRDDFEAEMEAALSRWWRDTDDGRRLSASFSELMIDMLRVSRQTGFLPHADSARYMRSVIATEGVLRRFAPGFDIADCLRQACADHLEAEALRSRLALERLADLVSASARALERLPHRLRAAVDEIAPQPETLPRRSANRAVGERRAIGLSVVALATATLAWTSSSPEPGWNVFTLSSAVALLCAAQLLSRAR